MCLQFETGKGKIWKGNIREGERESLAGTVSYEVEIGGEDESGR